MRKIRLSLLLLTAWLLNAVAVPEPLPLHIPETIYRRPGMQTTGTKTPGTVRPGTQTTGTKAPGTVRPGTQTTGTKTPGTVRPGTQTPGTKTPGTVRPGTQTPGTKTPATVRPGTQTPGTKAPATVRPGTQTPGTKAPATVRPGTVRPGTQTPKSVELFEHSGAPSLRVPDFTLGHKEKPSAPRGPVREIPHSVPPVRNPFQEPWKPEGHIPAPPPKGGVPLSLVVAPSTTLPFVSYSSRALPNVLQGMHAIAIRKTSYVALSDVAAYYRLNLRTRGKEVFLLTRAGDPDSAAVVKFTQGSRMMLWQGVQVYLSRAVSEVKGMRYLSKTDFTGLLDPLMRQVLPPSRQIVTILLDPGHGGKDTGALYGQVREKDINLSVARCVAAELRKEGFRVYLTRSRDVDLSLSARTKLVKKYKADLFISLHCNAAKGNASGVEVYLPTKTGDCPIGSNVVSTKPCPSSPFDTYNLWGAVLMQRSLLLATGMEDRGVRAMRYYVLRNVACPCMLIEMGFLSNAEERSIMQTAAWRQNVAEGITLAVRQLKAVCLPGDTVVRQ